MAVMPGHTDLEARRLAARIGYWSSLGMVATFVLFTACFVAIPLTSPLFTWTNLADYLAYVDAHGQLFQITARLAMLLFGPLFVLALNGVYELADPEGRVLARISLFFGVAFAALTGANYFIQISAVRLSILKGELQGLEQVVQANPISAVSATNVLGWSLFFGLASLFVAPAFSGGGLKRVIRLAFLLNGACCLLGGVGYAIDSAALVFVTLNFGMGGAVLCAATSLAIYFRRIARSVSAKAHSSPR